LGDEIGSMNFPKERKNHYNIKLDLEEATSMLRMLARQSNQTFEALNGR